MKILHLSDNHSLMPDYWSMYNIDPSTIDAIVHSGDFLPNWSRGVRAIEEPRQTQWVIDNVDKIAHWFRGRPVLFVPGNHDFINPVPLLNKAGLNVIDLCIKDEQGNARAVDFGGFRWCGSPWVPLFTGEWNYELAHDKEGFAVEEVIALKPDIIVSHGPIKGVLDRNEKGERCGSYEWASQLRSSEASGYLPKAFLCGHIHHSNGVVGWNKMIVSNAATTCRVLEIK